VIALRVSHRPRVHVYSVTLALVTPPIPYTTLFRSGWNTERAWHLDEMQQVVGNIGLRPSRVRIGHDHGVRAGRRRIEVDDGDHARRGPHHQTSRPPKHLNPRNQSRVLLHGQTLS